MATTLLVWLVREELSPPLRWVAPIVGTVCILGMGILAQVRRDVVASAAFLAGAILSAVPTTLSVLGEFELFDQQPEDVTQLLGSTFSNHQILVATLLGLGLSIIVFWRLHLTGFAWTTACLTVGAWVSFLLTLDWLGQDLEIQALWCLPLVGLEAIGLTFERRGRVRWAMPFHLVALATFVVAVDVIAVTGPTLDMLGLAPDEATATESFFSLERREHFSLALNGLVFLVLLVFLARSRSLDLRRAGRFLEIIAPLHLLGALYENAWFHRQQDGVLVDFVLYLAGLLLILALGPWRGQWRFLLGGLMGIALGSHLLIELDLVSRAPLVLSLGIAGLCIAAGTYISLWWTSRLGKSPAAPSSSQGNDSPGR